MVSWAHRPNAGTPDQPVTGEDWDAWRDTVLRFVTVLRWKGGVTADLDLFHLSEDWTRWGPLQIQRCPWTLVVVNAAWRERFEGRNQRTEGAGAVAEADELLGMFDDDQDDFRRRVLLVVLPGASQDDVPPRMRGLERFTITKFTVEGLERLLRHLTGQPLYMPPPVGTVPVLPPATLESASATVQAAAERSATSQEIDAPLKAELRDQDAVLNAALQATAHQPRPQEALAASAQTAQLRSLIEEISRTLFSSPAMQEMQRTTAAAASRALSSSPAFQELQRTTAAAARAMITSSRASSAGPVGAARAVPRLAGLLRQVSEAVERENRCWLLLAGALEDPDAAAEDEHDGRPIRQRRQEQVSSWIARTLPPVPLDQRPAATRTTGRVVLSAPSAGTAAPSAASSAWRLELGDHGEAVAAANVAGAVVTGPFWDPPEDGRRQYPDLHLPVRVDLLELWLLTQVQLLADHLTPMAADRGDATVFLQARLMLPEQLTHPEAYPRHGVRLVAATRDEDDHRSADSAVPGATDLQLGLAPPEGGPLRTTVAALSDPARLVGITQSMVVELLDRFGVEETSVLRADGTLDELAAGDQQLVWDHAGALGLTRDPISPDQRRQRYDELLAQARAALRR